MRAIKQVACLAVAGMIWPAAVWGGPYVGTHRTLNWHYEPSESSPYEAAAESASIAVRNARDQLHRTNTEILRQFEASSEVHAARLASAHAFATYQRAVEEARSVVHQSTEYRSAQIEISNLEAGLDAARTEARNQGKDGSDKTDRLAATLLERRSALSHRDAEAVVADSHVADLRYAWLDANAKVLDMESGVAQQIKSDGKWRAAKERLEQARAQLASVSK